MENLNAYQIALSQSSRAAEKLNLDPNVSEILKHPKRELTVSIPIRMDDGMSAYSKAIASSTMSRVVPRRAAFDITRMSPWTKSKPSRCG